MRETENDLCLGSGYLVIFPDSIRAAKNVGVQVGHRMLVVDEKDLPSVAVPGSRVYLNARIGFPLELPSAAGIVENDDNWGLGPLGVFAKQIWDMGITGKGVRIGIADSGLNSTLPTFAPLLSDGRLKAFAAFDGNGKKIVQTAPDGTPLPDTSARPTFTHWHGTFCAATIVGVSDGKMRGVSPASELVVTQVLQRGNNGTVASIAAGIQWLSTMKCDIVSLSLGWPGKHEEWAAAIEDLLSRGTVVVAAVGNEAGIPGSESELSRSPANYPIAPQSTSDGLLLAVGAHDDQNHVADFSSGETADWSSVMVAGLGGTQLPSIFSASPAKIVPDMVAPGVDIIEPIAMTAWESEDGSSMATPHIAGLIALILSALRSKNPSATPREAATILLQNLISLSPGAEVDREGKGKVNTSQVMAALRT
jgi:subtilisin family serine protease